MVISAGTLGEDKTLKRLCYFVALLTFAVAVTCFSAGQEPPKPGEPITLRTAIEYAISHYPAIRAAQQRKNAASAGVGLARTTYLPTANALWQGSRATRNNIFGLLLPQSVIPPISGPVLPTSNNQSAWGSAAGVLVGWEPYDFGYRRAGVDAAKANERSASAEVDLSRLGIAAAAAERFLELAVAQQNVRTAAADVERRETFARTVHVLVDNELRPGAEASRADAELAAARISFIRAQTSVKVTTAALADLLGIPPGEITIDAAELWQSSPPLVSTIDVRRHPAAAVQNARVQFSIAQTHIAERSYYPHFVFQSSLSGRGSGANVDGTIDGGPAGLELQRMNWSAGLTATFNLFDIFPQRERKKIAAANEQAEQERYKQTLQDLTAQSAEAQAIYDGAVALSQAIPPEVAAARQSEVQARARYQAGLTNVLEVSDAQSLLVRAEGEDNLAKLGVWRAMFGLAVAQGDLSPVLALLSTSSTGGH